MSKNSYCHLTEEERCQIYSLNKMGLSQRKIAKEIEVSQSTVSRELNRNRDGYESRHEQAQRLSEARRAYASRVKRRMTPKTIDFVKNKLHEQWSPEQISGWLKYQQNETEAVSHETIYQYVWADKKTGGSLYQQLRHGGKKYNKRGGSNKSRYLIPGRVDIEERPAIVALKQRVGDWECDTMIGQQQRGAVLVTMVDRASKLTLLQKSDNKTSNKVSAAMEERLSPIARHVITLTYDNGKEFSEHQRVNQILAAQSFFAKPYHSWERGLNEHTNGLIRQYFPKGKSLDHVTKENCSFIEERLNNRPRKVLGFRTPIQAFLDLTSLTLSDALRG